MWTRAVQCSLEKCNPCVPVISDSYGSIFETWWPNKAAVNLQRGDYRWPHHYNCLVELGGGPLFKLVSRIFSSPANWKREWQEKVVDILCSSFPWFCQVWCAWPYRIENGFFGLVWSHLVIQAGFGRSMTYIMEAGGWFPIGARKCWFMQAGHVFQEKLESKYHTWSVHIITRHMHLTFCCNHNSQNRWSQHDVNRLVSFL